jgi:hypothetical protein
MTPTEHTAKTASTGKTGLFALLGGLLLCKGTGASKISKLKGTGASQGPHADYLIARHGVCATEPSLRALSEAFGRVGSGGRWSREEPEGSRTAPGLQTTNKKQRTVTPALVVGLAIAICAWMVVHTSPALGYATIEGPPKFSSAPGVSDGRVCEQVYGR